jgi:hypothetical protein
VIVVVPDPVCDPVIVSLGLDPTEDVWDGVDKDVGVLLAVPVCVRVGILLGVLDLLLVTEGVPLSDIVFSAVTEGVCEPVPVFEAV